MARPTQEFIEWTDAADDEELEVMTELCRKSFIKWLLISFIPVASIFTAGVALFCYNNLCYLKSKGHYTGNVFIKILFYLWGLIIVPLIEMSVFTQNERLGNQILGWM